MQIHSSKHSLASTKYLSRFLDWVIDAVAILIMIAQTFRIVFDLWSLMQLHKNPHIWHKRDNSTNPTTIMKLHTPIVLPQSRCTIELLDNSNILEHALELYSRAAPSGGGITAKTVLTQGEIPKGGRTEKKIFDFEFMSGW